MDETLKAGAWIVHKKYGVGQIKGIETKNIGGESHEYFRVKISTGSYWLPIKQIPEHVRSVSSKYKLSKALRVMSEKPNILPKNYKVRNKQVAERAEGATLQAKAELIRDLNARKYIEGINMSIVDERQLATFRQQFTREMSVILETPMEVVEAEIDEKLHESVRLL
jgi:CarD family transcriptional regulator